MGKLLFLIGFLVLSVTNNLFGQTEPILIIDGQNVTFKSGVSFPFWLKAGQTINIGTNVKFVSILEFNVDSSNLKYNQTISLNSLQTVPASKTWKIEAVAMLLDVNSTSGFSNLTGPSIFSSPRTYSTEGNYTFVVPPGVSRICVEAWGPGAPVNQFGGGGGGGYGYSCFSVVPGDSYSLRVGAGYGNDTTKFSNLLFASSGTMSAPNNMGVGGSSNGIYVVIGEAAWQGGCGYYGGNGANGGAGGKPNYPLYNCNGTTPYAPGGGAGGTYGQGASGQIKIYW
jgi:hypothetical protein